MLVDCFLVSRAGGSGGAKLGSMDKILNQSIFLGLSIPECLGDGEVVGSIVFSIVALK